MSTAPGYLDVYNLIYKYVQTKLPNYGKIDLEILEYEVQKA